MATTFDRSRFVFMGSTHGDAKIEEFLERPFWVTTRGFPAAGPYPCDLFYVGAEPLAAYVDAILYLGPDPNRSLLNTVPLSLTQGTELDRRESLLTDPRRVMQIRYGGRDSWFRGHPRDFPERP